MNMDRIFAQRFAVLYYRQEINGWWLSTGHRCRFQMEVTKDKDIIVTVSYGRLDREDVYEFRFKDGMIDSTSALSSAMNKTIEAMRNGKWVEPTEDDVFEFLIDYCWEYEDA